MKIIDNIRLLLGNFGATITPFVLTGERLFYLPDKDGVLATLGDIPTRLSRTKGGIFDHFLGNFSTTVASSAFEFATILTGTGATLGILAGEANYPGILRIQTGTTTTGATVIKTPDCIQLGGGLTYSVKGCMRLPTLPDATENFSINFGFSDRVSGTVAITDGVIFAVDTVNPGAWTLLTRSNSVATRVNTSSPVVANTWYDLEIKINADGTNAEFYVNGSLVGSITATIPSTAGRGTAVSACVIKTAGTTSRFLDIDYISLEWGY